MAWWLRCLHCRLTAKRSWVGFQHGPLLVQGAGPPQTFSVQVGYVSPGPFCVEFACSHSVHKDPNITLSYQSLTKMDGSLHLVPGRLKAALGSWRKDNPGWGNAEVKFTAIVDITRLYTNENHLGTPYSSQLSWKYKELFSWC